MNPGSYLVGNPIYRGASNAPTRGTVDPMGYINRALGMSPVGRDGFSDKRSGLAQAALQRLRSAGGGRLGINPMHMQPIQQAPPRLLNRLPSGQINVDPNHLFSGQPVQQTPLINGNGLPNRQMNLGHTVSSTGQLLPNSGTPFEDTTKTMYGGNPQDNGPSEQQLMEAARNRLQHQTQVKEMITKHQLNMENMAMRHAHSINTHRRRLTNG